MQLSKVLAIGLVHSPKRFHTVSQTLEPCLDCSGEPIVVWSAITLARVRDKDMLWRCG